MLVEGGFGLLPHPGRTSEVVRRLRLAPSEGGYCDFPEPGKGWLSAKGVTWSKALGWNCPSSRLYRGDPFWARGRVKGGVTSQISRPAQRPRGSHTFYPQSLRSLAGFWLRLRCWRINPPRSDCDLCPEKTKERALRADLGSTGFQLVWDQEF